jgi:F-type H+-transporting ATPase subunit b
MNETFSAEVTIRFENAQDVICGIELTANGQKIAWCISSYLAELSKKVSDLIDAQTPPTIETEPRPGTVNALEPDPVALVGAK